MKLTPEQRKKINEKWGDWEAIHVEYDRLMEERLKELDPEYYDELKELIEGATLWYA